MRKLALASFLLLVSIGCCQLTNAENASSSIKVDIPRYEVSKVNGLDYVEIPGGEVLFEEGKPTVPYCLVSVEYPRGIRVQRVTMRERSGLETTSGLNLSVAEDVIYSSAQGDSTVGEKAGWFPEADYSWRILVGSDGSSNLVITVYPFYYNPNTTEVKFYRHYEFDVTYTTSTVTLMGLSTNKAVYDPGEEVSINLLIGNSGPAQEVVIDVLVRRYGSEEVIDGLPLRALHGLSGEASATMSWDSHGFSPGDYYADVTLNDTSGNWLDKRTCSFRIGKVQINVTSFRVEPRYFKLGETILLDLEAMNTGSCEVSGECIFVIMEEGMDVQMFLHNFSSLRPGGSIRFNSAWNTSLAKDGVIYHILGYVMFESQSTLPTIVVVSTNLFPVAAFSFTPRRAGVGEAVSFEATMSSDPDGEVVSFLWDFGDGGTDSGLMVKHAYYEPGLYEVTLAVTDDDEATNKTTQIIQVVMMYRLNVTSNVQVKISGSGNYREGEMVTLSAQPSLGMLGLLGMLGGKYNFKGWVGVLNSTENTVTLTFSGYSLQLEMKAVYDEDYSTLMIVLFAIVTLAGVVVAVVTLRKRGGRKKPAGT